MSGLFISFEGTEAGGKSTQIAHLAKQLQVVGYRVRPLREPGGTAIGEEIRHTLKHSAGNAAMTAETELLLMCASRAQLVREVIRPSLAAGEIILCDRFFDSTIAYQGYGRGLDLAWIRSLTAFTVGETKPDLTLLLSVPLAVSEQRRLARVTNEARDRMEEADQDFFRRVEEGYHAIAAAEAARVRVIDGTASPEQVAAEIWQVVAPMLPHQR